MPVSVNDVGLTVRDGEGGFGESEDGRGSGDASCLSPGISDRNVPVSRLLAAKAGCITCINGITGSQMNNSALIPTERNSNR